MVSLLTSKYPDSYYGYLGMVKLMLRLHHRNPRMVKLVIGFHCECSSSDLIKFIIFLKIQFLYTFFRTIKYSNKL